MTEQKEQNSNVKEFDVDDKTGKIETVLLKDGTKFTFSQFVNLFKKKLQTIIAGEVISFDDYWSYDQHISSEGMEKHLEVVEAEGLISSLKMPKLTKGQLISIGAIVILVFVALIAAMFLKSMGMLG